MCTIRKIYYKRCIFCNLASKTIQNQYLAITIGHLVTRKVSLFGNRGGPNQPAHVRRLFGTFKFCNIESSLFIQCFYNIWFRDTPIAWFTGIEPEIKSFFPDNCLIGEYLLYKRSMASRDKQYIWCYKIMSSR